MLLFVFDPVGDIIVYAPQVANSLIGYIFILDWVRRPVYMVHQNLSCKM